MVDSPSLFVPSTIVIETYNEKKLNILELSPEQEGRISLPIGAFVPVKTV